MTRQKRRRVPATRVLAALAAFLLLAVRASAATWTVRVGQGGIRFVDDASGTNVTTITAGDTVTWVWDGTMQHSVTSGTCTAGSGGGGYGGGYGGGCTDSSLWQSTGLQGEGFTFSQTFATPRTVTYYCAMHENAMTGRIVVQPASLPAVCTPDAHTLCLNSGRFSVTAHWQKPDGSEGEGNGVALTGDSGYFWFFDSSNIETVTKVLNGCGLDNAYWVFAAGLTNVAVHVTVTDTKTGAVYTRDNAQGAAFEPIQDTAAFPASCP